MVKRILPLLIITASLATPWLFPGDDHDLILAVQWKLHKQGYDPGPKNGILGPQGTRALLRFQAENGLDESGKIDAATLEALGLKQRGAWGTVKSGAGTAAEAVSGAAKVTARATATGVKKTARATREATALTVEQTSKVASEIGETLTGSIDREAILVAKVEHELEQDPRIDASKVAVSSQGEGAIRLTFKNGSESQWSLVVARTRSVEGVKQVFVHLPS